MLKKKHFLNSVCFPLSYHRLYVTIQVKALSSVLNLHTDEIGGFAQRNMCSDQGLIETETKSCPKTNVKKTTNKQSKHENKK